MKIASKFTFVIHFIVFLRCTYVGLIRMSLFLLPNQLNKINILNILLNVTK